MAKASPAVEKKISGIIIEELANEHLDEKDKTLSPAYKEYYKRKIAALGLEKENRSKIIIFESVNNNPTSKWYKMVGNSALFYKYFIGARLRKAPMIRADADLQHKSKSGVIALNSKEKFVERMAKFGYTKYQESELGLTIFDLGKKFTDAELEEFKRQSRAAADKFNSVVKPKDNFPDIYTKMLELLRLITPKLKHMNPAYRELIGKSMTDDVTELMSAYLSFSNGAMSADAAKEKLTQAIMNIRARLILMSENRIFEFEDLARIGGIVAEIEKLVKKRIE